MSRFPARRRKIIQDQHFCVCLNLEKPWSARDELARILTAVVVTPKVPPGPRPPHPIVPWSSTDGSQLRNQFQLMCCRHQQNQEFEPIKNRNASSLNPLTLQPDTQLELVDEAPRGRDAEQEDSWIVTKHDRRACRCAPPGEQKKSAGDPKKKHTPVSKKVKSPLGPREGSKRPTRPAPLYRETRDASLVDMAKPGWKPRIDGKPLVCDAR